MLDVPIGKVHRFSVSSTTQPPTHLHVRHHNLRPVSSFSISAQDNLSISAQHNLSPTSTFGISAQHNLVPMGEVELKEMLNTLIGQRL